MDTNVLVLAIATAQKLSITELWFAFGTGKNFRYLAAHEMLCHERCHDRCYALSMFHALTGRDMVSSYGGRGKKTCWNTWNAVEQVTQAFGALTTLPNAIDDWFQTLERFVVLLYDRTSSLDHVNEARKVILAQKGRQLDQIPPTKAALLQHVRREVYKTVHCWGQMIIRTPKNFQPNCLSLYSKYINTIIAYANQFILMVSMATWRNPQCLYTQTFSLGCHDINPNIYLNMPSCMLLSSNVQLCHKSVALNVYRD